MPTLVELNVTSRHGGGTLVSVDSSGNLTVAGAVSSTPIEDYGVAGLATDTIAESTAAAGVTVDSLLIKDGKIQGTAPILADTISEKTSATGVTVDGVLCKDSAVTADLTGNVTGNTTGTHTGAVAATTVSVSSTMTLSDGSLVQRAGAGTSGDKIEVVGPDATHGMAVYVYEQTVSPAAIETALITLPANSVVDSVQANVEAALTGGGTTATFGIGITGDVDCYGTAFSGGVQADLLTKNAKLNAIGTKTAAGAGVGVYNAATVAVKLIGAATGGTAAGDTALTAGSVKVRIVYRALLSIADAA